jgi:glycosyl transferase, family 25
MFESDLPIYVVNLKRRVDRKERLCRLLGDGTYKLFSSDIGCSFDSDDALELIGKNIKIFDWRIVSENPWWNRPVKLGEVGCLLSHHACWRHASVRDKEFALFFEDDVSVPSNWRTEVEDVLLELAAFDSTWDILYLGREDVRPCKYATPKLVIPTFAYNMHAYALSRAGIAKLLSSNIIEKVMPLDEYIPATYGEHPREDVAQFVNVKLKAYAARHDIFHQALRDGDGVRYSDTESSDYVTKL